MKKLNGLSIGVVIAGAIPFFLLELSYPTGGRIALQLYALTACLFGILLAGEYPSTRSSSFGKVMFSVVLIHALIVATIVWSEISVPMINRLPARMIFGAVGVILVAEWRLLLLVIEKLGDSPDHLSV